MKEIELEFESGTKHKYNLDTSLCCQINWEKNFPDTAKTHPDFYALWQEVVRMKESTSKLITETKLLFCFLDEPRISWKDFVREILPLTNPDLAQKNARIMGDAIIDLLGDSAEKN